MDEIIIEKKLNINDDQFENLSKEIENNTFFLYLTSFNKDLIVNYEKEEDGTILLYMKNIVDESDEELSLVRFKYTITSKNNNYILNALQDKDYENDDFFITDFDNFNININKKGFKFIMTYNPKKYPKCIYIMIKKYFERIFLNLENSLKL